LLNNGASADCQVDEPLPDAYETRSVDERELFFGSITREENVYGSLQSSYMAAENSLFYTIATARPDMLNMNDSSDFSFQQYFNNLTISNTGIRHNVFSLIEDGDYAQAYILNNSILDTSTWDKTSKEVNRIYLDSWCQGQFNFATQDRDSLWSIAHASPYEKGNAVFSARVLLGLDPDQVPLPHNLQVFPKEPKKEPLVFYPNPSKGILYFKLDQERIESETTGEIVLLDLLGRTLYKRGIILFPGENSLALPKVSPGVYLIRLMSVCGLNETTRLILD